MKFGVRKLVLGLPDGEEIMPLAFFVLTIPARDRQTDRHVALPPQRIRRLTPSAIKLGVPRAPLLGNNT